MHPILFHAGPWPVYSYGVLLSLSVVSGLLLAQRRARRIGVPPRAVFRMVLVILAAGIFGSHALYVAVNATAYSDPLAALFFLDQGRFRPGGLVMNGGVIAALGVLLAYIRLSRLPLWGTLDALAPSFALGIFLTRIGCFLNGCCYGIPSDGLFGVTFPPHSPAGQFQRAGFAAPVPVHPAQLYCAACGLGIFVLLLVVERRCRPFEGATVLLALLAYAAARFAVEFVRHDAGVWAWHGLTYNQTLSAVVLAASLAAIAMRWRRAAEPSG